MAFSTTGLVTTFSTTGLVNTHVITSWRSLLVNRPSLLQASQHARDHIITSWRSLLQA